MLDPTGDLSHQDLTPPQQGMQHMANTLGLKATTESKKYYIKKSYDAEKYKRMTGQIEISCKKGAENRGIMERVFEMKYR